MEELLNKFGAFVQTEKVWQMPAWLLSGLQTVCRDRYVKIYIYCKP
jgi:hypothetical protein